jgi:hypothetical protein
MRKSRGTVLRLTTLIVNAPAVTEEGLTAIVEPVIVATSNGALRVDVFAIAVETSTTASIAAMAPANTTLGLRARTEWAYLRAFRRERRFRLWRA